MTTPARTAADPRDRSGPFARLFKSLQRCKQARTCEALPVRGYYFEPNLATIQAWQADEMYTGRLDRRVAFVCESPGGQFPSRNPLEPSRCWCQTGQDERFRRVRAAHGFLGCYLTNVVKCGVRTGSQHAEPELAACRLFLVRELDLIRPMVAVGVGDNAYRTLRTDVLPCLTAKPVLFEITHYSARGNVASRWEREFAELDRLLTRLKPRSQWTATAGE